MSSIVCIVSPQDIPKMNAIMNFVSTSVIILIVVKKDSLIIDRGFFVCRFIPRKMKINVNEYIIRAETMVIENVRYAALIREEIKGK